jgi:exodeoxyribonuclease V alpha subunit
LLGNLLGAQPGESLRMQGHWTSHPQYGRQFEVHTYTTMLPATVQGLRRYLGSGLIKGIGPTMAERIVTHFDLDTLRVIEEEPQRLSAVPGLGPKRTAMIGRGTVLGAGSLVRWVLAREAPPCERPATTHTRSHGGE